MYLLQVSLTGGEVGTYPTLALAQARAAARVAYPLEWAEGLEPGTWSAFSSQEPGKPERFVILKV